MAVVALENDLGVRVELNEVSQMIQRASPALPELYETDETAWLEAMSELIRTERLADLDYANLAKYLADMARRDKREVLSRLATLIAHLLKWGFQPEKRTNSWSVTIEAQRQQLAELLESGVLHNYADEILARAYGNAVRLASRETDLPLAKFPRTCPYTLDGILAEDDSDSA